MTNDHEQQAASARLLQLATRASLTVAVILVLGKAGVWLLTGSLSVLASLVDSGLDAAASLLNLVAVRFSLKSADRDHPFGHGKAESLAGLGQALFIGFSALFVISRAVERFNHPRPLAEVGVGIAVMLTAILITFGLVLFQRRVVAQTGSAAIKADSLHYASDLYTNLGTILVLALAGLGWTWLDPLVGVLIALVVIHSAWQIAYESTQMLLDCHLSPGAEAEIARLAQAHEKVLGVHDIRTRRSGQTRVVQLHLEMAGELSLAEAHQATKEVELRIREIVPQADIIIHQDPVKL
ncbi:MAG: cation diffusion facilitator family transporter [Desulfobulbaceae bacterium]|nr:cation diffusion facilitator family transporter [Desulfobulbaceae bacterium]